MSPRVRAAWVLCAPVVIAATMMVSAQSSETFTVTASVKRGGASAFAPVTVTMWLNNLARKK